MAKFRLSFANYYFRNIIAYFVVLLLGLLPFFGDLRTITAKRLLLSVAYYSFVFLWVLFHNKVLLSKLILKKRIFLYIFSLPFAYVIWYIVAVWIARYAGLPLNNSYEIFLFIVDTALGTAVFLSAKYLIERKQFYQTSLLKRDIELQQLKTQLNPHFLFNALNNIYSYTLHNNKYGNDLILRLSELMRFILESSEKDKIIVSNEINFIENYIAFEKERLGDRCTIIYSKNILFESREITPLILFPFVENAFKYGADSIQKTTVEIRLDDNTEIVKLVVKNSIINKNQPSTKKGLPNAIRRLELLYPEKHNLLIEITENMFIVDLTLRYDKTKSADSR